MSRRHSTPRNRQMMLLAILIGAIIALLLGIEYFTIVASRHTQAQQTATLLIDQVRSILLGNEKREQSLTDSLKEEYISKAKAVSYIIDNAPNTEKDVAELIRIATLMSLDEIHLFTEDGEIYGGTVKPYYGFTFDSGEQMAYFKPMLTNKALSMCQDVTPNTAEGKSMMYAICWNDAGTRMVQVGVEPRRLIEMMRTSAVADVIAGMPSYDGVDILVARRYTGEILGSTSSKQIGNTLDKYGIDLEGYNLYDVAYFDTEVSGQPSYCAASSLHSYAIIVVQNRDVVNRGVSGIMLTVFLYLLLAAAAIALIVRRMTRRVMAEQANANTDHMTGFFNRRAYESDMKKYDRGKRPQDLVYISLDLNGLKEANDNYGHEAGDKLISGEAQCMRHSFGSRGRLYRIGGDEFVAMVNANEAQLEKMKLFYEHSSKVWSEKNGVPLSAACGYVRASDYPGKSMAELAKLADQRMYAAKAEYYRTSGRDRRIR